MEGYQPVETKIHIEGEMLPSVSEMIRDIKYTLGISQKELAQMHGVAQSTIRRWLSGWAISDKNHATVTQAYDSVRLLKSLFVEDRIPHVIRREANLLLGMTALDLILKGQIADVADFYDDVTLYSEGRIWGMLHRPPRIYPQIHTPTETK